ncbi:GlsB/YeaQ/YmgE family stress response membrane protein [Kordiimonas sp. SCSIO 12603]|uniref:GlsB/YeaQ/YmgE family stress response membrane protein n=1 Tax=Kordiimonas sp. SCSIO 12603 TaxID=2829596 RepID=UPI002106256E|nr:GlsB/YeaQ/YmgE family stress response membrane protein [Kordiimonas sp. SCSIO 12603]UTW59845.1 GlsB/YeaQ/YmgE family stress response membrane protein [Kordiimonas sp. SCSIO 12603]
MIYSILIGALVGFIAGKILRGEGMGAFWNILIGIAGGVIGKFLFGIIGFHVNGLIADIIAGTAGAVLLMLMFDIGVKKRRSRD